MVALWRWHVGTFVDAALIVLIVVDAALIVRPSGTAWTACRERYYSSRVCGAKFMPTARP